MARSHTRELARRAIRREIAEAAERLFLERGYERTTVDEIAAAVDISSRTFFRYFATKDEVLFLQFDELTEGLVATVDERPADEPPWETLHRVLRAYVERGNTPGEEERSRRIEQIAQAAPTLTGILLNRMADLEHRITESLLASTDAGPDRRSVEHRATYRALVGSAFAALIAANREVEHTSPTIEERLALFDSVIGALRPAEPSLGG